MYLHQILKSSTISYIKFHIHVCSVCNTHFPSFKTYVMFVMHIIFHLKPYVRKKYSLSFKTLVMFVTHILFSLEHAYCLQHANSFIQNGNCNCNVSDTHFHIILHSAPHNNRYLLFIYLQQICFMYF